MMETVFEQLPELTPWQEAEARVQLVKARLAQLERIMPDADEQQRSKMLAEQSELVAESQTLPATVGELARRYCLAHLSFLEANGAQAAWAKKVYGVQNLLNRSEWARCVDLFAEQRRRQADHELHGNFDSCVSAPWAPRGPRPQRSKRLPLP